MTAHANGTIYGKYLKVKNGSQGVKNCSQYINDPVKTIFFTVPAPYDDAQREIFHLENSLRYIQNDPKTRNPSTGRPLVSGHNCSPDTVVQEFSLIEKLYHSHKTENLAPGQIPNQAFHIILSYKGTDTSPELIHEMGREFARRLCGDEFQALISTHLNTDNYHNHVLVNAYALDGGHKFKDSFHVYRRFRDIANEISLEYGLPIFVNEEWKQRYRSWKEVISTEEGQCWKQDITARLEQSMAASSSYEEVLESMERMGYEVQKNPRTVTFKKDGIRVRDSRLGYQYTKEGITQALAKQARNKEHQKIADEVSKMRKEQKKKRGYPSVYIPTYDRYGKRRSFLIRLLLLLRESVRQAMDEYYSASLESAAPDNHLFMRAEKKLALLDESMATADRYGITSPEVLDMKLRELHARLAPFRGDIFNLEDCLERGEELKGLIGKYRELLPDIKAYGLSPKELTYVPAASLIRENKARLNPTRPKTRSDLFKAVHKSGYSLTRKFNTLTEHEARLIIHAIEKGHTANLPDGLVLGRIKGKPCQEKEDLPKRNAIDFKRYDAVAKEKILAFKAAADTLASYGLTDARSMDSFLKDLSDKTEELDALKADSGFINAEIKELYKLKRNIDRFQKAVFVYGPVYSGNADGLKQSLTRLENDASRYDWLSAMKNRLDLLPQIPVRKLDSMEIPDGEEYRFIHDFFSYFPDTGQVNTADPVQVHLFVAKLKSDGFFDREMKKELEREMKNVQKKPRSSGREKTVGK